jgi:hypothetical protein
MNPCARETPSQYALRRCCEDIQHIRIELNPLNEVLHEALQSNAANLIAPLKQKLKEFQGMRGKRIPGTLCMFNIASRKTRTSTLAGDRHVLYWSQHLSVSSSDVNEA